MLCLWRRAYLALAFSALAAVGVSPSSFLGDSLIRHNPVQNVLEHESVRGEPLCQHSVCSTYVYDWTYHSFTCLCRQLVR